MPHRLKSNIRFLDKSFQENQSSKYILSIMYSEEGFAFSLFHTEQNKFTGFINFTFEKNDKATPVQKLDKLVDEYGWLRSVFSKVYFIVDNPISTLIPFSLFAEEKAEIYLDFNQKRPENSEVGFDSLKNNVAINVYSKPVGLTNKVTSLWPGVKLLHSASALLEILAINFKNLTDNNRVFIQVHENRFDLVYFRQNKLHFYNSFKYKTKEDFIYFILAAFEQLKINPEEVKLTLMGTIDKSGKLYQIAYNYIRNIYFIEPNENFGYSFVLDELQPHFYYVLFNVLQCG